MKTRERDRTKFAPPPAPKPAGLIEVEHCVTCGNEVTTPFCAYCGEKRASDRTYSMWEFIKDHVVESVMNFDGRVLRTFKTLFRKPGELTAAFMRGVRLPYLAPIQTFLLFNLGFFLWSSATKSRILDTPLSVHTKGMPYSDVAARMVREKLAQTGQDPKAFEQMFDTISSAQARSLVLIMVPAFALAMALITLGRKRRPAVQHLVFSLHSYSALFFLAPVMVYVVGIPMSIVLELLHVKGGLYGYDAQISLVMAVGIGTYLSLSARRAYQLGPWRSAVTGLLATFAVGEIMQLYRRLLFFLTFWSM